MPKFQKYAVIFEAEQFFSGANPETWPLGVQWGGDLPDGTGCYIVITAHGHATPIADGDWIIPEPNGNGFYPCKPDIFKAMCFEIRENNPMQGFNPDDYPLK